MTEKRRDEIQVSDMRAVNPRYKGAKMSDVARALMRPKDPKVQQGTGKAAQKLGREERGLRRGSKSRRIGGWKWATSYN